MNLFQLSDLLLEQEDSLVRLLTWLYVKWSPQLVAMFFTDFDIMRRVKGFLLFVFLLVIFFL